MQAFFRIAEERQSPVFWEVELATVPRMAARLGLAAGHGFRSAPSWSRWQGALVRAYQSGVTACDTRFVELAVREGIKLATFDAGVLKKFPGVAVRPLVLLEA